MKFDEHDDRTPDIEMEWFGFGFGFYNATVLASICDFSVIVID